MTRPWWLLTALLALPAPVLAQTSPASAEAVAERQIAAFNQRDLDAFMALYAEDAVVMEFPSGAVLARGKAAIRDRYAGVFRSLPKDFSPVRVEPRVVDGSFVLEHERWDAPPGQRDHAVWMYEIRDGLIRQAWTVRMAP